MTLNFVRELILWFILKVQQFMLHFIFPNHRRHMKEDIKERS